MPSNKALAPIGLGMLALTLGSAAPAQQDGTRPGARAAIGAEGEAAMQRLHDAAKARLQSDMQGPVLPGPANPAARQRAFQGLQKHKGDPALEARARAALTAGEARMAASREAMALRLRQALGLEAADMAAIAKAAPGPGPRTWVPVLFASSSMPVPVLRNYAQQLERVRGVLAFRGVPGGLARIGPMAKLSAEILRIDPGCNGPDCAMRGVQLIVDPIVFRQHGVTRVPALAMIPGDPTQPYCEREDESPRAAHLVYGDSALTGLLEHYARLGGKEEVRDALALASR